jgi:hypothetical protein
MIARRAMAKSRGKAKGSAADLATNPIDQILSANKRQGQLSSQRIDCIM